MICVLLLLLFQPPQDIQGVPDIARLQNIRWGMTVSEADRVIGAPRTLIQKPYRDTSYLEEIGETGIMFEAYPRIHRWSRPYSDRIALEAIKFGGYTGDAFIQTRPHSDTVCCIVLRLPLNLDSGGDWSDAQIKMNAALTRSMAGKA
jgi:hypothetical protein